MNTRLTYIPPDERVTSPVPLPIDATISELLKLHGHYVVYTDVVPDVLPGWETEVRYVVEVRKYRLPAMLCK